MLASTPAHLKYCHVTGIAALFIFLKSPNSHPCAISQTARVNGTWGRSPCDLLCGVCSVSPCSVQPEGAIDSSVGGIAKQCPHPVTRCNPVTHLKSHACPKHCEIATKMCRKAASRLFLGGSGDFLSESV